MENLDYFFPNITTHQSREILLEDPIPFAFLIRQVKREYVVTFLDNNLEFRDEKIQNTNANRVFSPSTSHMMIIIDLSIVSNVM